MESQERDNSTRTPEPSTPEPSAPEPSAPEPSAPEYDNEHKIKNDAAQSEKLSVDSNQKDSTAKEGDESTLNSANGEGVGHALHSSASGNRDKSNLNGEIVFEAKKKKSKTSDLTAPDSYSVTFTVSIAMATPTVTEEKDHPSLNDAVSQEPNGCEFLPIEIDEPTESVSVSKIQQPKKKRVFEAPRPQSYYHVEYYLVPGEDDLMKTDIVTYGMAAKLFMERHDARVIKTWQDGELTWIAWAHSHTLVITKEVLLKLFDHTIELRVWDMKEKCSTRARFDRPKAFRLPQPKPGESLEDVGGVKAMVMKQHNNFLKMQSPKANPPRPLPQKCVFPLSEILSRSSTQTGSGSKTKSLGKKMVAVKNKGIEGQKTFNQLGVLAGSAQSSGGKESRTSNISKASSERHQTLSVPSPPPPRSSPISGKSQHSASSLRSRSNVHSGKSNASDSSRSENSDKKPKKMDSLETNEHIKKFGICMVPFRMALLFSGSKCITSRLQQAVPGVEDMFISVALDQPLLSDSFMEELNPMILTIKSVTDLPNKPLSYADLNAKCEPVYCQYQFLKLPTHISGGKEHEQNIYWDDKNVVLLGIQDPGELREYLSGTPMIVEVHDRDRKLDNMKLKPTLFGDDLEDEKISNVGTVTSRRTLHNPFIGRNKPWDPYGVGRVDLSELLLGHRYLELKIPIHNCPLPDILGTFVGKDNKVVGLAGAVDGPVDRPLPPGKYLHHGTSLKIEVELAHPIVTLAQVAHREEIHITSKCAFSRIIFIFAYKNTALLHLLQQLIVEINAKGLDLEDMPQHVIDAALSTYKLSIEQQADHQLDILTGFHVLDKEKHIFVLEGLRDHGISRLWNELPRPEYSDVRVLYNSDLCFGQRLYGSLDVDLCRIKLHEPLRVIVQQPLLYVRDMVPRICFEAIIRLEEISRLHLMKDIVKNDLFPTSEMVISMSREFGVPFTVQDFEELQPEWQKPSVQMKVDKTPIEVPAVGIQTSRQWTPIDNFNSPFVALMTKRKEDAPAQDFISQNKEMVKNQSSLNSLLKEKTKVPTVHADVAVAHNYSTQTLNSTEIANEEIRSILSKDQDSRFTRCQEFHHSMTFVPVSVEALRKREEEESKMWWRTKSGWIYPGRRTMAESNAHPKKPHLARIQELSEIWRENSLHVSLFQPPLDRDNYAWDYRYQDFQLYAQPRVKLQDEPKSIHLPGIRHQAEKLEAKQKELEYWQSHLVVNDPRQYFHRLLPQTEMTESGFYSSNQIDRLTGLLKDQPQKLAIQQTVCNIPALSVVTYPSVDTVARKQGQPLPSAIPGEGDEKAKGYKPGPYVLSSWTMENNRVPAFNYEHDKHIAVHGQDFNVLHTERQKLWTRPIIPLSDNERDNHLFRSSLRQESLPGVGPGTFHEDMRVCDISTSTQDLFDKKKREIILV